jgi:hypothetical protein
MQRNHCTFQPAVLQAAIQIFISTHLSNLVYHVMQPVSPVLSLPPTVLRVALLIIIN